MTTAMDGKAISRIWFIADNGENIQADSVFSLELSATHHGDRDDFWIVQKKDGVEIARHNPRAISTIEWREPKERNP